jgi:hypothetical protein
MVNYLAFLGLTWCLLRCLQLVNIRCKEAAIWCHPHIKYVILITEIRALQAQAKSHINTPNHHWNNIQFIILKLNSIRESYYCNNRATITIHTNSCKTGLACHRPRSTRICAKMFLHTYTQLFVPSSGMVQWWASSSGPDKKGSGE